MHLQDGELRAYLDGEMAGTEQENVRAHLETCPRCQAQAACYSNAWGACIAAWKSSPLGREKSRCGWKPPAFAFSLTNTQRRKKPCSTGYSTAARARLGDRSGHRFTDPSP